jgi:hypothetical protein
MRCWIALAALAMAGAQTALAQEAGANPTPEEFIDAHRPVIASRALTSDEKSAAKRLIGEIRKKNAKPHVENVLLQLHPIAVTGDKAAMSAMMVGWKNCGATTTTLLTDYPLIAYGRVCNALSALWAMKLWEAGERTREVARQVMVCLESKSFATYGDVAGRNCGVNARVEGDYDHAIDRFADGEKGAKPPFSMTFTEYALAPKMTPEQERARFERWVAAYSKGAPPDGEPDGRWVNGYLLRQPEAVQKEWSDALDKFWAIKNAAQGAERVAAEEAHKRDIAEWESLNAKRIAAREKKEALPAHDEERFVRLSFRLRGKYIVPYGMENVLTDQWAINDFCGNGPSSVCDRQRNLAYARQSAADEERLARELAWSRPRGGGDVSVRTYDQNGNYLGSSSMPAWQADILTGN